jgi:phospholipase/lecithinase/hemolysin
MSAVKTFKQFTAFAIIFGSLIFSVHAGFSSIYVWGDSLSTTTNNSSLSQYYYGQRYSNGRNWVEVLAQRQGLGANSITNVDWNYSSNNLSFYGQYSPILVANVAKFLPPPNATNCLFVVWVNNADFVGDVNSALIGAPNGLNNGTNLLAWTTAISQHLANHLTAITALYAKGCRTLIAPSAADITETPEYNNSPPAWRAFVRQQIISFNASYSAMLQQIAASSPGLTIYNPDIFSLLDNVLTNAASYGLTNAVYDAGEGTGPQSIDAIDAYYYGMLNSISLNGPANNYIFWDPISPTAQFSEVIADNVQQYLSPVQFRSITAVNSSNQVNVTLNVTNLPVGLSGFVDGCTNLAQAVWTPVTGFNSVSISQSISVIAPPFVLPDGYTNYSGGGPVDINPNDPPSTNSVSGPPFVSMPQFYSLRFPFAWQWP